MTTARDRLLDAAEDLFFSDGIAITGVDAVAASAGVAIATLYAHFGSKDGLLAAVLERRLAAWTECWEAAVAAADSPADRLLAVFDAITDFRSTAGETQWCCFLATASERSRAGTMHDPVLTLVDRDTTELHDRLVRLAEEARLDDPAAIAGHLALVYNGVLASLLRGVPADPVARGRRIASAVVAAGA